MKTLKMTLITISLLACNACNSHKKIIQSSGNITSVECENVWRSSNLLQLKVLDENRKLTHHFKIRLRDIQCDEVEELLTEGQNINFKYENAGYKKTALAYLKVNNRVIFDKNL